MKNIIIFGVGFLLLAGGWLIYSEEEKHLREEIIERYDSGEKKWLDFTPEKEVMRLL